MRASAHFVAPASCRRFFRELAPRKTAGETPAPQDLLAAICFANSLRVAGAMEAHEG